MLILAFFFVFSMILKMINILKGIKMKKLTVLASFAAMTLLTACGDKQQTNAEAVAKAPTANQALADYKEGAKTLVTMIKEAKPDTEIAAKSAELVAGSKTIITQFINKHPKCTEYLTALNNAADIIPTLPLEEIESGYHEDGKLPKFDDPNCYHAKDLLVHPATVQAMATMGITTAEMRESAEMEIIEVIAHFSQVEKALN